ncbi:hypothetical protein RHSIM_Rhsim12G0146400 [Rhododendron simsii]|uniref:Uncharacterized protein n=1 Tax=Rhododendron simsii TaxID=118357 RepID=A0A834L9H9_RHOSS|nr:hypothetical protein RHSIM_Rhsim12G0146400 [Rhododendron simsii]
MSLEIFQLKNIAQPLAKYDVGNGQNTFLWLDFWHPIGPLFQLLQHFGNKSGLQYGKIPYCSGFLYYLSCVSGPIQQNNKSVEAVILGIVVDVRACLMGWTQVPNSVENKSLCRVWVLSSIIHVASMHEENASSSSLE